MLLPKIILTFEQDTVLLVLQNKESLNPLTQFNYSSLQKDTAHSTSFGISGGKSFDVGSEGKLSFFATASFSNDFHLKAMEQQKPV
jgi:hypothetical protein